MGAAAADAEAEATKGFWKGSSLVDTMKEED
jgi:hypothetical protein